MKRIIAMLLAIVLVLSLGISSVFAADEPSIAAAADIPYIDDGDSAHLLNIYGVIENTEPRPLLIRIHGGGFFGGTQANDEDYSQLLADNGFNVVSINYSLMPAAGTFQNIEKDIFAALGWIDKHAEEYCLDLSRVVMTGDSAGGYLTNLTATILSEPALQEKFGLEAPSYVIRGCVLTCPEVDILELREDLANGKGFKGFMAKTISEAVLMDSAVEEVDLYSIINPETYPKMYIITTPQDDILYEQAVAFDAWLTEKGIDHELHVYEQQENKLRHVFNTGNIDWVESVQANEESIAFLKSLIGEEPTEIKAVYCIGDSLTFGVIPGTAGKRDVTYPDVLAGLLGDGFEVINAGKPGRSLTEGGVCYLKVPEYQQSIDAAADMYIIMLGTNDANLWEKWDAEAYEHDLNMVVDAYKEANPDTVIVLIAPPTVLPSESTGEIQMDKSLLEGSIHDTVQKTAEEKNALFIDMFAKTTENPEWVGSDGIHFTQEGYTAMGEYIYDCIKGVL